MPRLPCIGRRWRSLSIPHSTRRRPSRRAIRRIEEMRTESKPEQEAFAPTAANMMTSDTASGQSPAPLTSDHDAIDDIRFSGSHVYALQPDGNRLWTVHTDGALVGTPVIRGTEVLVTTVKGTRYTLRASDGTVFSRVPADDHGEEKTQSND